MNKKRKKGFTLIELLVVIAIIGLLATLSVVALNNARERARDSRRVSDIRQIQTALEMYYNENPTVGYPASTTALVSSGFMNPIPTAPTPADGGCAANNTYVYTQTGTPAGSSYTLTYCLGNDTAGIKGGELQTASPLATYSVAAD
jgi:prepilin-type N-terminal cleavage/methylation domain-containing protein